MKTAIQKITPFLWFNDQAEEAARYYTSIFRNSRIHKVTRYNEESAKAAGRPEGTAMTVEFELEGQHFTALNGGPHVKFSEAVSFVVNCGSQEEVDYYWEKLSDAGDVNAQQCGWLKDKFGLSWQIIPTEMIELLNDPDPDKARRALHELLRMKKIDLTILKKAA